MVLNEIHLEPLASINKMQPEMILYSKLVTGKKIIRQTQLNIDKERSRKTSYPEGFQMVAQEDPRLTSFHGHNKSTTYGINSSEKTTLMNRASIIGDKRGALRQVGEAEIPLQMKGPIPGLGTHT